jgi:HSP20 family protein
MLIYICVVKNIKNLKEKEVIMRTLALNKAIEKMPSVFEDYFKPWNEWFDNGNSNLWGSSMNIPAVNITEQKNEYLVSLAVPGLKKDDFKIDIDGNMLTISSEKEETKEEKDKKFTRKEYNYSSFSRSFTLPDEINKEKIDAKYENGILKIALPRKEEAKKITAKHIDVK